jgi:hypothetical protein
LFDEVLNGKESCLQEEMFCDEFHLVDLRVYENCKKVVKGCEHVFNLAADMGGEFAGLLTVRSTPLRCCCVLLENRFS